MKRLRLILILTLMLAMPLLACTPRVGEVWGDLVETARTIWAAIWATPEPDSYAVSLLSCEALLAAHGNPPTPYVGQIIATAEQIAAVWGIAQPYSVTFSLGPTYPKPDGSGRVMAPFQFTNPYSDVYGVPVGGPVTGLCLEFEEVDVEGTPAVPLLADGYQVGDWVLPTTTPVIGYAVCPSGITPTPTPTPTPTATPVPIGDGYEPDNPYPPNHSAISVGETQWRSLDPTWDEEWVWLWVWPGLHLEVRTGNLGGYASTNMSVLTGGGTLYDDDGGEAVIEWTSTYAEVVIIHVWSANGYYGPGETYTLEANQLP